ncbi:hypothetical protein [Streptomyces sp. NPDC005955]|uniref:hypothetical protein n=1 Tax=Streptomyces sp. NPDC005955 TaxID=3364738 RepID=UPI0036CC733C
MTGSPLRTQAQHRRRRALHSAAAGRTTVVLYFSLRDSACDARSATAALRAYVFARDWDVTEIVMCDASLAVPLDGRAQWSHVRDLVAEYGVDGVVAVQGQLSLTSSERAWFTGQGAFLCEVSDVRRTGSDRRT